MSKCNVTKKKVLIISNNKCLQETAVLRKIVVQGKTMLLVIALFTFVILFILCTGKSRLHFAVDQKKEDTDLLFLLFFRRSPPSEVF